MILATASDSQMSFLATGVSVFRFNVSKSALKSWKQNGIS
jgi:hypothetical protein